jgi:two-component system nitrogen regulation sensor histidine kinase NtrY
LNPILQWAFFATLCAVSLAGTLAMQQLLVRPLRSLASVLEALRQGDYSLCGLDRKIGDALGDVMNEIDSLRRNLYEQRLRALEADVLLEKIITELDIALFTFDAEQRLLQINPAGAALLGCEAAEPIGRNASELGLGAMLEEDTERIVSHTFPGAAGRWEIRRRTFRKAGRPHQLLVISDLSRALREEERRAWRRIVRVIGHELNSSLAPIKSIAATLRKVLARQPVAEDWRADAHGGLTIIHDRAEALARFMGNYARLARLPFPVPTAAAFAPLVQRAASLYREQVAVEPGPQTTLVADHAQIEHVLINLLKNAVEATAGIGDVRVRWYVADRRLIFEVEDDGPGLAQTESLWVPFFTTKPEGSGIGLALSREIVENHRGAITLQNRNDARGCLAQVTLPLE